MLRVYPVLWESMAERNNFHGESTGTHFHQAPVRYDDICEQNVSLNKYN